MVEIYNSFPKVGMPKLASNIGQYLDFKEHAPAFDRLALWRLDDYTLGEAGGPSRISGAIATTDFFDVLDLQPLLGRFFTAENHVPAADKVAVLTQSFWESHFQSDPGVVGRTVRLDGERYEIIGVAPRLLEAFDARIKFLRPISWPLTAKAGRLGWSPELIGRLVAGRRVEEAAAQVTALEKSYFDGASAGEREFLGRTGKVVRVDTLEAQRSAPVRSSLYVLQGGVLFVLLIGCVNVANLLLSRAIARSGEFGLRAALGADWAALARQLFVESALLTCVGTAGGLLLAWGALNTANRFAARLLPNALPFSIDAAVLGTSIALSAGIAVFVGLLPVLGLRGGGITRPLNPQGRAASPSRSARAAGATLIVAQVAFALVLLTGAGLLARSFANVLGVEPGLDPRQLFSARIAIPGDKEKSFPPRIAEALREIPGIQSCLASSTPFLLVPPGNVSMPLGAVELRGFQLSAEAALPSVFYCGATPSYLETLRIPLREGRWLNASDMGNGRAVVVDESFARRLFPGRSAVGQQLVINSPPPKNDSEWLEIVGVVGNVPHNGVEDGSGQPFLYLPLTHMPLYGMMSVLIRTSRPESEILALLREKVAAIDPELPVYSAAPMGSVISETFSNRRGVMLLLAAFAGIAVLLSAVGIYGVLAYDVSRRTREIGIRSAIGATRGQIVGLILSQGVWRSVIGIATGFAGAAALSQFISALLFGVNPLDPGVVIGGSVLLLAVATLACWIPARNAARVDPIVALRTE
jgi:predicted permease